MDMSSQLNNIITQAFAVGKRGNSETTDTGRLYTNRGTLYESGASSFIPAGQSDGDGLAGEGMGVTKLAKRDLTIITQCIIIK